MRGGLEIIDTDQHVGPNMETLHKYAGRRLLARWDELLPYFVKVTEGHHLSIDPIPFKRELNTGTESSQTEASGAGARSRCARRSSRTARCNPFRRSTTRTGKAGSTTWTSRVSTWR